MYLLELLLCYGGVDNRLWKRSVVNGLDRLAGVDRHAESTNEQINSMH